MNDGNWSENKGCAVAVVGVAVCWALVAIADLAASAYTATHPQIDCAARLDALEAAVGALEESHE